MLFPCTLIDLFDGRLQSVKSTTPTLALISVLLFSTLTAPLADAAMSVSMEIDGNVRDDSGPGLPLDWADLFAASGAPVAQPGFAASVFVSDRAAPDASYHAGSDKDTQDLSTWECAPRNNPQDKSNVLNAYASVVATAEGKLALLFGFERASNLGNAYMGLWLLQRPTTCVGGAFTGPHVPGDLLVLSDFTRGGAVSTVRVYAWDPTVDSNLRLVASPAPCAMGKLEHVACAVTNSAPITTPWAPGALGANQLLEGIVDLAAVLGAETRCFASFLAQTRSSQELTAELKDYALGTFTSCDARLTASPATGSAPVGTPQDVVFTAERDLGSGWRAASGVTVQAAVLGGPAHLSATRCTTGADGTCRITVTAPLAGESAIVGTAAIPLGSLPADRTAQAARNWFRLPSTVIVEVPASVPIGEPVSAETLVTGDVGPATGPVGFSLCRPDGTSCTPLGSATTADGTATSPAFTASAAGEWCIFVDYGGDARYLPAGSSSCFLVTAPLSSLTIDARVLPDGERATTVATLPGGALELTLDYANLGNAPARAVTISSFVPARAALVSCGDCLSTGDGPGSQLTWSLGTVPSGESRTVRFTILLAETFPAGSTLLSAPASVATDPEGVLAAPQAEIEVDAAHRLSVALDVRTLPAGAFAVATNARPSDLVEYRVRVANDGNADASQVAATLPPPPRSTFLACTGSCILDADGLRWDLGTIAAGTTREVVVQFTLDPVFPAGATLLATRAAAAAGTSAPLGTGPAVVTVTASPASALDLAVRALPDGLFASATDTRPRELVEFRLAYRNDGDADASGVKLRQDVPAGLRLVSCACAADGATLAWDLGTVPAGASRVVTFAASVGESFPAGVTLIANVATASSAEEPPRVSNEASVRVHAAPVSVLALTVAPDGGGPVVALSATPDDLLHYALAYRNDGNAAASSVVLELPVPAGASVEVCGCVVVDGILQWPIGSVAPGDTRSVVASLRLDPVFPAGVTELLSVAQVATAEEGRRASNNVLVSVFAAPVSLLAVDARALPDGAFAEDSPARPGDAIEVRLLYRNAGTADASAVRLRMPLPGKSTFVACTGSCAVENGAVEWIPGLVPARGSREVTLTIRLDSVFAAGTTRLVPTGIATTETEPEGVVDSTGVVVTASPATSLDLAVRVLPDGEFASVVTGVPGDGVEYRLLARNSGNAPSSGTRVLLPLPDRTEAVGCAPECVRSGEGLEWDLGGILPGETHELRIQAALADEFPAGQTLLAAVGRIQTAEEGPLASNVALVEVVAEPRSVLALEVAVADGAFGPVGRAAPGDLATFRVEYGNVGDAGASDVRLTATLPARSRLLGCGGCELVGAVLLWRLGDIPRGLGATRTFEIALDPTFPAGETVLPASADAASAEEDTIAPATASLLVIAAPASSLALDVRVGEGAFAREAAARPSDVAEWRLTYRNDGNAPASSVVLTIPEPARSAVESCPAPCASAGGLLRWSFGTVEPGDARVAVFAGRLDPLFPAGTTTIALRGIAATAQEDDRLSNEATVIVVASASPAIAKAAVAQDVRPTGVIEYRIAIWNEGDGHAGPTVVRDALPLGTSFVACEPTCVAVGGVVSWLLASVPAGTTEAAPATLLSVSLRLDRAFDCVLCNVATLSGPDGDAASKAACVPILPALALASARGESAVLWADDSVPGALSQTVKSSQVGPGEDSSASRGRFVSLGDVVTADTFVAQSTSTVEDGLSRTLGFAELANVDILDGTVTARVARAVAEADATEIGGFTSPAGSIVLEARINGVPVDVRPGQRIPLGPLSYVAFLEREVFFEEPETSLEGWWTTRIIVSAIRVHLAGDLPLNPGGSSIDFVVGRAEAIARYPRAPSCGEKTFPGVEASTAAATLPDLALGPASISKLGGDDSIHFLATGTPEIQLSLVDTRAEGRITEAASRASSSVRVADACMFPVPGGCRILLRAVRAEAEASHDATGRFAAGDTEIGGIVVDGQEFMVPHGPSTIELAGIGFLVLEEVLAYRGEDGREGVVVRAARLVVTSPAPGLADDGVVVVVGEALAAAYHPQGG